MFEYQNTFHYGGAGETLESLRQEYLCPISRKIMTNPVVDQEGISYQKEHIQKWYLHNDTSPLTNGHVFSKKLIPNYYLQDLINKVEAQLPALCSFIQILKNEIFQLRAQNEMLRKEVEFDTVSNENDEGKTNHVTNAFREFQQEQKSQKMLMLQYKEKKENQQRLNACAKMPKNNKEKTFQFINTLTRLRMMENNKKMPIINECDETEEQRQKQQKQGSNRNLLSKRKMIKKRKLQQCFDLSMEKLLKKNKTDWAQHLDNINVEYSQATSKHTKEIQQKEQSIKRSNETIKIQEMQIAQLNKMVEESKFSEIKIFEKLKDLSAQFKALLENKPLVKKDPKQNIDEFLLQLRQQNELMRKKLNVFQNEEKNLLNEKSNNKEVIQTHTYHQNIIRLNPPSIPSRPYRIMLPFSKYKTDLIQLQGQFERFKLKKNQEISRQLEQLTIKNENLQKQLVLSTSQIKKIQQKQRKEVQKLQASNEVLSDKIKELKNTIQGLKKSVKLKQRDRRGDQTNLIKQLSQLQNEKTQLLKLLQQAHQTHQRSINQSSVQIKGYIAEILNLNEIIATRHQIWMFIFFNIFASLHYNTKDIYLPDQNIYQENKKIQIKQPQQIEKSPIEENQKNQDESESLQFEKQNINLQVGRQQSLTLQSQLNLMVPQNQSQLPHNMQQNSNKLFNQFNRSQIIDTQHSFQKQLSIFHQIQQQNQQQNPDIKYPQVIKKIKGTIQLFMSVLQLNIQKNLQTYGEIFKKSPKQTIRLYQRIQLIYQSLQVKTAWNFWSVYKINLDQRSLKYNGFQMDAKILLKIVQEFGWNTFHWEEVISISSVHYPIDTDQWKGIARHSYLYPNLQVIKLNNNKISQVTVRELLRWKNLKSINFRGNPLNEESIGHLERYAKKYPHVEILYDLQPSVLPQVQSNQMEL